MFDTAAFARTSWCLHLGGVFRINFVTSEPILLGLVGKRRIHEVSHIFIRLSITSTSDSSVRIFVRELAVSVSGLFDYIRSVLFLTFIIIDPFLSRKWLSCFWLDRLHVYSVACCIKLHVLWVAALLEIWHSYVRILWQLGHHKIDYLWAKPSRGTFDILDILLGGQHIGASNLVEPLRYSNIGAEEASRTISAGCDIIRWSSSLLIWEIFQDMGDVWLHFHDVQKKLILLFL